ncbi:MAG: 2-phospho-L-lactate guanylyltransferase [candidate division WS1 bacterium]|nr:2-phospho-L-lactate guanylyltransferase [candidate division WS1 bacterium]
MCPRSQFRILVPQKALDRAKTRLRSALSREARTELTLRMLRHTLEVCRELNSAGLMLSGPDELADLAREFEGELVLAGEAGMRRDIMEVGAAVGEADQALLIVSSDLPLVNVSDLEQVVAAWRKGHGVVLVPDRRERGTNVMLVDRPEVFPFAFGGALGQGSLETHLTQALGTDLSPVILKLPALALDLDLPADLAVFVREAPDHPLARFCLREAQEDFTFE